MRYIIYKGVRIFKEGRNLYRFTVINSYSTSRLKVAKLIIDSIYKECEKSDKLVSVCEFQPKNKVVFDWGEQIMAKFIPAIVLHCHNSFLIIEEVRSLECKYLINECSNNNFIYFN